MFSPSTIVPVSTKEAGFAGYIMTSQSALPMWLAPDDDPQRRGGCEHYSKRGYGQESAARYRAVPDPGLAVPVRPHTRAAVGFVTPAPARVPCHTARGQVTGCLAQSAEDGSEPSQGVSRD
jgi:hypothetical protein